MEIDADEYQQYSFNSDLQIETRTQGKRSRKLDTYELYSGYWSEQNCHRLLRIYLKHMRALTISRPTGAMWHIIMREFDKKKHFTISQVKAKLHRLKLTAKRLLNNSQPNGKPWPYLSAITELLRLEESAKMKLSSHSKHEDKRCSMTWTDDETFKFLDAYQMHLRRIVEASSAQEMRLIWSSIAASVNFPRYLVQLKFQSLKYTWRRYENCDPEICTWVFASKMREINETEKKIEKEVKSLKTSTDVAPKKRKWLRNETIDLLERYYRTLERLRDVGVITTKRSAYVAIAKEIGVDIDSVQIKLASLKAHWKARKHMRRYTVWVHTDMVDSIMKLEGCIWKSAENEEREFWREERDSTPSTRVDKETALKEWMHKFREEEENRHKERLSLTHGLINSLYWMFSRID